MTRRNKAQAVHLCIGLLWCFSGCVAESPQARKPTDECGALSRKYGANVIQISDKGRFSGYASLHDASYVWVSSGRTETNEVRAEQIWEIRPLLANEMRSGIKANPSPPKPPGPNDDLF